MDQVYWGNTVSSYLLALGAIVIFFIILKLVKRFILLKLRQIIAKSDNRFDDVVFDVAEKFIVPFIYLVFNYNVIKQLNLHPRLERLLDIAVIVVCIYFAVRLFNHVMQVSVNRMMRKRQESEARIRQLNGVLNIVKIFIWGLGFIFLLDNLGYNVTTLLTGLGIGGIAVALAAQTLFGDLFSYFTIFFDKPFEVGDFIIVNGFLGTIEYIGLKTTRLRALSGEQLIMSNSELTKATIQNFKRMQTRRVVFQVRVKYETPRQLLQQVPDIIREKIQKQEGVKFDRSHLLNFGEYSVNYEAVYIKLSPDYNIYMDTHHEIMLEIHEEFERRGIKFAYPANRVFMENEPGKSVKEVQEKLITDPGSEGISTV